MGKSSPSAPASPDPTQTAQAQTASNEQTALYNYGLDNPNVNTPLGNINYSLTNSTPTYDETAYNEALQSWEQAQQPTTEGENGKSSQSTQPSTPMPTLSEFETSAGGNPQANANVTLSPAEQQIFNENVANIQQQGNVAGTALSRVTNLMNTPYNLQGNVMQTPTQQDMQGNINNVMNANYAQQAQYLDPEFSQAQSQLQSQLTNQGLAPGSQAYQTAMNNLALQKQQAYGNAQENAVGQGISNASTLSNMALNNQAQQAQLYTQQYQEPLNLYSSLMAGTAPTMPSFNSYNASSAAPTNTEAAQQMATNAQLNAYNAQTASANSTTSGLFGLGSSLGSAALMCLLM